jgi:hypothetical protein
VRRGFGLAISALIVGAAIAACRPTGDVGYVGQDGPGRAGHADGALSTPPSLRRSSAAALSCASTSAWKLQADWIARSLAPLCDIEVKERITTVTVSVLERPPRCQCRFNGSNGAADHPA